MTLATDKNSYRPFSLFPMLRRRLGEIQILIHPQLLTVLPGKGCASHLWPSVKVFGVSQVLMGVRISQGDFETFITGVHSV